MVNRDNSYTNLSGNGQTSSAWLEKQQSGSRKSKFIVRPPPFSVRCKVDRLPESLGTPSPRPSPFSELTHWTDVLIHLVSVAHRCSRWPCGPHRYRCWRWRVALQQEQEIKRGLKQQQHLGQQWFQQLYQQQPWASERSKRPKQLHKGSKAQAIILRDGLHA